MYKAELNLVRELVRQLRSARSPWGRVEIAREFCYQRGRTDVVALMAGGPRLVAFEAKLSRWRDALHQAYRNTCFAHTSFVVLPRDTAVIAEKFGGEFQRRNIGLCYLDGERIVVVYAPEEKDPIEPWLSDQAAAAVRKWHHASSRTRASGPKVLSRTSNAVHETRG